MICSGGSIDICEQVVAPQSAHTSRASRVDTSRFRRTKQEERYLRRFDQFSTFTPLKRAKSLTLIVTSFSSLM